MVGRRAWLVALVAMVPTYAAGDPEIKLHRMQACDKTSENWCIARSTNGGFAVELPMPFNDFTMPAQTLSTSGRAHIHVVGGVFRGTAKLSAMCLDYVEGKPDVKSVYANFSHTMGQAEPFVHEGFTGRRYRKSEPQHHGDTVVFVGSNFQCILTAETFGDSPLPPQLIDRFLRSFSFPATAAPLEGA